MRLVNTHRAWTARVTATGLAAALLLSACGQDENTDATASNETSSSAGASTSTSTEASTESTEATSSDAPEASSDAPAESSSATPSDAESSAGAEPTAEPSTPVPPKSDSSPTTEPGPDPSASPSTAPESSAPASKPKAGGDCEQAELTASKAFEKNAGELPALPGDEWVMADSEQAFDACADLSWVTVTGSGVGAVPSHLMLFHQGEYIGTAVTQAHAFAPDVRRVDDDTLEVTYLYLKEGEASANASGRATSRFTYDAAQGTVSRTGELPPDDRDDNCTDLVLEEAVEKNIKKVPPVDPDPSYRWYLEESSSEYDPCADLSWAVLGIRGTASSPFQIMLFHDGEYVGTTLKEPRGFLPEVKRLDDGSIEVLYRYLKEGEATFQASGRATATFEWDDKQKKVVQAGDLPPAH